MNKLAKTGHNGDPIETSLIWSWKLPLNKKWVPEVASLKGFLSSFLEIFKLDLFWKINSTAISTVSVGGMLGKRLQMSYEIKK